MTSPSPSGETTVTWTEAGGSRSARWRSERGLPQPHRVLPADDTLSADAAYKLVCEGTALLWRGDFHNARQLLQALERRVARAAGRSKSPQAGAADPARAFHRYRAAQAQRGRLLGMLLLPFGPDYSIPLRRAPDAALACTEAWGPPAPDSLDSVASLRELLGLISAHEWRKKGVEVPALGTAPGGATARIHPHYGVFSPVRGEYIGLVASAALPQLRSGRPLTAFDIGTGTGVLAAVLARRGVSRVVATDQDPRALACARDNLARLGVAGMVQLVEADLFPPGQADLVVCNPPWLPARPGAPIERAVYDEGSRMLLGFLQGLAAHLAPGGEGWLILSDLAEHLGLRTRAQLQDAIAAAGLKVLGRLDTRPQHSKAFDPADPLHSARSAEVSSLWRLAAMSAPPSAAAP